MNFRQNSLLALGTGVFLTLSACNNQILPPVAGGSDEIDTRMAVDRHGLPIAGARIALVRSGDSTNKPVALGMTAKDGTFPSFIVPDGYYSVVVRDPGDTLGKFTDSVHVINQRLANGRDTLLALGSVRGVVRVASVHSPTTVTIALLGTDILANVKSDGTFLVDLVPGSLYTLAAIPSLDGYRTLYKRIELKDGQNLTLPDTLEMPFQGLPAPSSLMIKQDSATGDVHLVWNRVHNPDLLDYEVVRVENGVTTSVFHISDTSFTDSLYFSWNEMPLFGPWPTRDIVYLVTSRSISGNPDSPSIEQAFTASPPSWTKRLDSLKVRMTTDPVTGTTTLKWNTPAYPDIAEWQVVRYINDSMDCVADSISSGWNDAKCRDQSRRVLQIEGSDSLIDGRPWTASYTVRAHRKKWFTTLEASTDTVARETHSANPLVVWRDSTTFSDHQITSFSQAGDWISQNEFLNRNDGNFRYAIKGCVRVSNDGVHWIDPPLQGLQAAGQGDSIWFGRRADSSHYALCHRTGQNTWSWDTILVPTEVQGIQVGIENEFQLGAENGWPILTRFSMSGSAIQVWKLHDRLANIIDSPGFRKMMIGGINGMAVFPIDSTTRLEIGANLEMVTIMDRVEHLHWDLVQGESVLANRESKWGRSPYFLGAFSIPAILFTTTINSDMGNIYAIQGLTGNSWLVPSPTNTNLVFSSPDLTVFHDEIWTVIDGHLWKGKVNLPK